MDDNKQWEQLYGSFDLEKDYSSHTIHNLPKESTWIRGEIIHSLKQIEPLPKSLLLPGEPSSIKYVYAELFDMPEDRIKTAGLQDEVDYKWDYEKDRPRFGRFDLIISQAMLEHLTDPYKHVRDLAQSLTTGGHLLVHTVIPGFPYHRYPVDCVRFFPDWFEEVGNRLKLKVVDKYIGEQRILYRYQKTTSEKRKWFWKTSKK